MEKLFFTIVTLMVSLTVVAQEEKNTSFKINGYLETYYLYNFNKPADNRIPGFMYSYNRSNEVNLNLGFIRGMYTTDRLRANLAVMAGTYPNANLAAESGTLKNIFEANAGVRISKTRNLWVDAGIFTSHIGFESAIGKDCWTLTRSILAENSPYYESGVKLSYTSNQGQWFLSGMILNGWQRIQRVEGNTLPSFGTQVTFKPSSKVTLNSSSFIGTDKPDSARQMRYFHNFYGVFQVNDKFGVTLGFDWGAEEKSAHVHAANVWYSPVLIARYAINSTLAIAVRGEYYQDEKGVIISTGTPHGFKTSGVSANLDYNLLPNALWRIEVRNLISKDEIFASDTTPTKRNALVSTSLAISF